MVLTPPASLVPVKGKLYVQITIPEELRSEFKGQKQLRRSTRTNDKALAKQRQHGIATKLYEELEEARKKKNPFRDAANDLLDVLPGGYRYPDTIFETVEGTKEAYEDLERSALGIIHAPPTGDAEEDIFADHERRMVEPAFDRLKEAYAEATGTGTKDRKLSELAKDWLARHPFGREKTKLSATKALDHFIQVMGDLLVSDITKKTAYDFCSAVTHSLSQKTIKNRISYASQCLTYGEKKGILKENPFYGLKLSGYGTKGTTRAPLTTKELGSLLSLPMPDDDRLILTVLSLTGMRLDEAALLTWESIKEEGDIPYFDLTKAIVKNAGSARKVPIIPVLKDRLPTAGTGRLFSYRLDKDGKAATSSSKQLMKHLRKVTKDRGKVIHSIRHTYKDLLRDAHVSTENNDFITGHSSGDVAGRYGKGPSLKTRLDEMLKGDYGFLPPLSVLE